MTEISRKLASFRTVSEILPIEGADKIEIAKIDGWQVVTQKGWATPGKLVIYFEVDSFLPIRPEFEFLRKSGYRAHPEIGEGFRLKTIKLRGELSQGLIMPINELFPPMENPDDVGKWGLWNSAIGPRKLEYVPRPNEESQPNVALEDGEDLTEVLKVKLWEAPIKACLKGMARGNFPSFIPKTDQERVQNLKKYFGRWDKDRRYQVTLKLDGSSMTVYRRRLFMNAEGGLTTDRENATYEMPAEIGVCSRNLDLKRDDTSVFFKVFDMENLEEKINAIANHLNEDIALQGEVMGPGVQGNREKFPEYRFYVYDIWSITKQAYKDPSATWVLCDNFGLRHVPLVMNLGSLATILGNDDPMERFLELAKQKSINHDVAEGVVLKAMGPGPRHSFKVINNDFLLAEKD
jgi:RNA ligase (TIGR02306 family)